MTTAATARTPPGSRDVVFVDVETSGVDPRAGHEILELAALRLSADLQTVRGSIHRQTTMTRPAKAESEALQVCRYSPEAWRHAGPLRAALVDFALLLDTEVVWAGHKASFDEGFIREAAREHELILPRWRYTIDTLSLAWPLAAQGLVGHLSLSSLCGHYGIPRTAAHTAAADVVHCASLYAALLGKRKPVVPGRWG